jgi:RNA-directed DNA polymerase
VLENKVKPVVESFLKIRGLVLSEEKTKITSIHEGFDFLGANIRKYGGKLIIRPAKSNVKRFLADIRETIKKNAATETEALIHQLNSKIQGWANYHCHVCAKKTFVHVDNQIFLALRRWAKRRHPNKTIGWVRRKYFRSIELRNWVFTTREKDKENGKIAYLDLRQASKTPIKRHVKIRADATPFNPIYHEYLSKRVWTRKKISWERCWWELPHLEDREKTGQHNCMALQEA